MTENLINSWSAGSDLGLHSLPMSHKKPLGLYGLISSRVNRITTKMRHIRINKLTVHFISNMAVIKSHLEILCFHLKRV